MIVPFNLTTGEIGVSSYSIGVWTAQYLGGYDTFALPLKLNNYQKTDWYCENINNTVGVNFFIDSGQRWSWHSRRMPEGVFDPIIEMVIGYQISTSDVTMFSYIGV